MYLDFNILCLLPISEVTCTGGKECYKIPCKGYYIMSKAEVYAQDIKDWSECTKNQIEAENTRRIGAGEDCLLT